MQIEKCKMESVRRRRIRPWRKLLAEANEVREIVAKSVNHW